MKKTLTKIIALTLTALFLCTILASCGKTISGKYEAKILGTGATYEFKGKNVTIVATVLGADALTLKGTYKIEDDKITITLDSDDKDAKEYNGTFKYEKTDDGIKIGSVEYKKVDK